MKHISLDSIVSQTACPFNVLFSPIDCMSLKRNIINNFFQLGLKTNKKPLILCRHFYKESTSTLVYDGINEAYVFSIEHTL